MSGREWGERGGGGKEGGREKVRLGGGRGREREGQRKGGGERVEREVERERDGGGGEGRESTSESDRRSVSLPLDLFVWKAKTFNLCKGATKSRRVSWVHR